MASPHNPFASGSGPESSSPGVAAGFGTQPGAAAGTFEVAKPPVMLLITAVGLALVGVALGVVGWGSWLAIVGWVFAGPIGIGVLALFIAKDTNKRALPTYLRPDGIGLLYAAASLAVVAGIVVSALGFAFWVGHR